jgi:transcription elongation factor GreB
LLKSNVGDVLKLVTPQGVREIEVLSVTYPKPS